MINQPTIQRPSVKQTRLNQLRENLSRVNKSRVVKSQTAKLRHRAVVALMCVLSFPSLAQASTLSEQYAKPQAQWPAAVTADNKAPKPLKPLTITHAPATPEQIALGKRLFEDPTLSRDNSKSCASCHDANKLFADQMGQAIGIDNQVGTRNTPAIFGIDHWESFFWDGRAATAEEQALGPIENPIEMDLSIEEALKRLNASTNYVTAFASAYGIKKVTADYLSKAIVAFERTIPAPNTPYQQYITLAQFNPKQALELLTPQQLKGLHLFRTKAKCMTCHEGALLSDNEFHVTGFHNYGRRFEDLGVYAQSKKAEDVGKFRTPSLLGITKTAPWMHNGLFIEFVPMIMQYNTGGFRPKPRGRFANDPLYPTTTNLIQPLNLSKQEIADLVAFLEIL